MMSLPEDDEKAARNIAKAIQDFRDEFWKKTCADIEKELAEVEASGFDPARGRGRGPAWADGA